MYQELKQGCDPELIRDCRAAYCGMVETLDGYVGQLYERFRSMEGESPHLFCYTSDHGEQMGRRQIFGKQTLYEEALRVPLHWAGDQIPAGKTYHQAVSLLDVSRTILEAAGGDPLEYPLHHGTPLAMTQEEEPRWVRAQQVIRHDGHYVMAELAVRGNVKLWSVDGETRVYELPEEEVNLLQSIEKEKKNRAERLLEEAERTGCFIPEEERKRLLFMEQLQEKNHGRLARWGMVKCPKEPATVRMQAGSLKGPWRKKSAGEGEIER